MDYITVAQNFGVAFVCLVALSLVVWRTLVWMGTNVVKPVADRLIKFLDDLSTAVASQSQALQTMAIQQGKNLEGIRDIMGKLEEVIEGQNRREVRQDRRQTRQDKRDNTDHGDPDDE